MDGSVHFSHVIMTPNLEEQQNCWGQSTSKLRAYFVFPCILVSTGGNLATLNTTMSKGSKKPSKSHVEEVVPWDTGLVDEIIEDVSSAAI